MEVNLNPPEDSTPNGSGCSFNTVEGVGLLERQKPFSDVRSTAMWIGLRAPVPSKGAGVPEKSCG